MSKQTVALKLSVTEMKKQQYDYDIQTEKLVPPMGGIYHYAATVGNLVKVRENAPGERVSTGLGEVWGTTRDEAREKMERAVKYWIDQRSEHYEDCPGCKWDRSRRANPGAAALKDPNRTTTVCAKCDGETKEETAHIINGRAYCQACVPIRTAEEKAKS